MKSDAHTPSGIFYRLWKADPTAGKDESGSKRASREMMTLLMGYSGNLESWPESFLQSLFRHADLLLVDHRGTGQSARSEDPSHYTIEGMASDVLEAMNHAGVQTTRLFGYSLGASIAVALCKKEPDRVSQLTLMSGTPGGSLWVKPHEEVWNQISRPAGQTTLEKTECIWKSCLSPEGLARFRGVLLQTFQESSKHLTPRFVMAAQLAAYSRYALTDSPWEPPFPVVILHGREDRLTPAQNSVHFKSLIPRARLLLLDGVEHMPHIEAEEQVVRAVFG